MTAGSERIERFDFLLDAARDAQGITIARHVTNTIKIALGSLPSTGIGVPRQETREPHDVSGDGISGTAPTAGREIDLQLELTSMEFSAASTSKSAGRRRRPVLLSRKAAIRATRDPQAVAEESSGSGRKISRFRQVGYARGSSAARGRSATAIPRRLRDCSSDEVWATTDNARSFGPKVANHYGAVLPDQRDLRPRHRPQLQWRPGDPLPVAYPFALLDHSVRYEARFSRSSSARFTNRRAQAESLGEPTHCTLSTMKLPM